MQFCKYLLLSILTCFLLIFTCYSQAAIPALWTGIKIKPGVNQSEFIFLFNKKITGRMQSFPSLNQNQAQRLVLTFQHTTKTFPIRTITFKQANVFSISTKILPPQTIQLIFKAPHPVQWNIRFLPNKKITESVSLQLILRSKRIHSVKPFELKRFNKLSRNMKIEDDLLTPRDAHPVRSSEQTRRVNQTLTSNHKVFEPPPKEYTQDNFPVTSAYDPELLKLRLAHQLTYAIQQPKLHSSSFFTVVIDPGHGGKDTGAIGNQGLAEKTVVLAIAKKLAKKINVLSSMRAVLTRQTDQYISLRTRLNLARQNQADLFIAIHADAYFNQQAKGASVYALSPRGATSEAARWLAQRENYSELDGIELHRLQDNSLMLRSVLIDLAQTITIHDSLRVGNNILDALEKVTSLHYQKVEQARFVVLKSPDIPSVLVETGFISHPQEEKRLADPAYQDKVAHALAQGIQQYAKNRQLKN